MPNKSVMSSNDRVPEKGGINSTIVQHPKVGCILKAVLPVGFSQIVITTAKATPPINRPITKPIK
jgi:hypothetical protein